MRHKVPCKHMYLVSRIYRNMEICYDEELTLPLELVDYDNGPTFSLEAILSPSSKTARLSWRIL
jgi:hypothetical protein